MLKTWKIHLQTHKVNRYLGFGLMLELPFDYYNRINNELTVFSIPLLLNQKQKKAMVVQVKLE